MTNKEEFENFIATANLSLVALTQLLAIPHQENYIFIEKGWLIVCVF